MVKQFKYEMEEADDEFMTGIENDIEICMAFERHLENEKARRQQVDRNIPAELGYARSSPWLN